MELCNLYTTTQRDGVCAATISEMIVIMLNKECIINQEYPIACIRQWDSKRSTYRSNLLCI